jgi:2-polyprenyl-3-methyl-5-hydroxy-6-metoxy-1,4-benzoquinol methylase
MTSDDLEERLRAGRPELPDDWAASTDGQSVFQEALARASDGSRDCPSVAPAPASSARSFDPVAEVYERFAELTGGLLYRWLRSVLPQQGARALDLGCGSGQHSVLLADRHDEVIAVDLSEPMLELARAKRSRQNVTYRHSDLREVTSERDGGFDVVLSSYTLHHIGELEATLQQIRSLVTPGGLAILIDIVDRRGRRPRWMRYWDAARRLPADLMQRGLRGAVDAYCLRTHPAWLAHLDTDRYLTPPEFERRYGAVFEGARFTALDQRTRAMWWRNGAAV